MNKLIITTFFQMIVFISYGQYNHSHKLYLGAGMEWNSFLSPSTLSDDDELLKIEDLWDNGTLQTIALKNSFKIDRDKYRLKWKVNGSLGIYQTEANSNRFTYQLGGSYRLKYASKKYLEFAPDLFRKYRQGTNTDNAVLATPFSYTLLKLPVHTDFYLGNKSWLKMQAGYLYKNYDKPGDEKLFYGAPFFTLNLSKKWINERSESKLTFSSNTQLRNYTTRSIVRDFEEDEDRFRDGTRSWTYQFTDLRLSIADNQNTRKVEIGVYHISRLDANRSSTFHELGPGLSFKNKVKKLDFQSSVKYTSRYYTQLSPGSNNDKLLKYNYLRLNIEATYSVSKVSHVYAKAQLTNRTSNNPDLTSRAFREYMYGFVELGIKLKW